jgi:hypothetical protein
MAGQTSVASAMTAALQAGQIADSCRLNDVASYVSEESSAEMPFGRMLAQGTADDGALLMAAATDKMIGVLTHSQAYERDTEIGDTGVKPKMTLGVMKCGRIWVTVTGEACTPASAVRVHKTGGYFLVSASAGNTVLVKHARYLTSAASGELTMLEFDILTRADNSAD